MLYQRLLKFSFLLLSAIICLPGCGGGPSDQPDLVEVHGKVTLDGAPVPNITVLFRPEEGGRDSSGITNENGEYVLIFRDELKGVSLGTHQIWFTPPAPIVAADGTPEEFSKEARSIKRWETPKKHREMTETVTADSEVINFDLTSD